MIDLLSVEIRHESRVRLLFSNTLGGGAFGVPAPGHYTLTNLDGLGSNPTASAAMLVPNSPTVVELALSEPLVAGALYRLAAVGVPATDLSTTPPGTQTEIRFYARVRPENREQIQVDRERLLYGVDIVWNGTDFEETPSGDLARVSGVENVTKALWYGVTANGLPWAPTWGGHAREFVDSPSAATGTLRGSVTSHVLSDPRVKTVKATIESDGSNTYLHLKPTLKTGDVLESVAVKVPNG